MTIGMMLTLLCAQAGLSTATDPLEYQYQTEGFSVSIPSAEEAKVGRLDGASIQAAVEYLEGGALSWIRGRGCINCHTNGTLHE